MSFLKNDVFLIKKSDMLVACLFKRLSLSCKIARKSVQVRNEWISDIQKFTFMLVRLLLF